MALGFTIQGSGGNTFGIGSDGYGTVATTKTARNAGFSVLSSEIDSGVNTGSRLVKEIELTEDYRLRVGTDTPILNEFFTGTAINTSIWTAPVTTMTATVGTGLLTLNAGNSVASGAVARVSSWRSFPVMGTFGVACEIIASFPFTPVASNTTEWGLGIATGTSAPTDGAFFRLNSTGELRAVINYNGTESQSGILDFNTYVGVNTTKHFIIVITEDAAQFWVRNSSNEEVLLARVLKPTNSPAITSSNELPVLLRCYNNAATSSAQQLRVSMVNVTLLDANAAKPYPTIMTGAGNMAIQTPTGVTVAQTAQWANSAAPATATITNTTAPSGTVGLGGIFKVNEPSLAADTDYIIQSYLNPIGTSTAPGKTLYITGYRISCMNMVVANGAAALTWAIGLGVGGNSVTLAASESATTKARRIMPIGMQSLANAAAVGVMASPDLNVNFDAPIVINQGEYIQTVLRFLAYTSTATQVLQFVIAFNAYFE